MKFSVVELGWLLSRYCWSFPSLSNNDLVIAALAGTGSTQSKWGRPLRNAVAKSTLRVPPPRSKTSNGVGCWVKAMVARCAKTRWASLAAVSCSFCNERWSTISALTFESTPSISTGPRGAVSGSGESEEGSTITSRMPRCHRRST